MSFLEEESDLSKLTPEEKLKILNLPASLDKIDDLIDRGFNLDGLDRSHNIPLKFVLAFPDKLDKLFINLKIQDLFDLLDKIIKEEVCVNPEIIKQIIRKISADYYNKYNNYSYISNGLNLGLGQYQEAIINLDKSCNLFDEKIVIELLTHLMDHMSQHKKLVKYLIDKYIPLNLLSTLLSYAICASDIKIVKFLLEKTDDFDEKMYESKYIDMNIVELLYDQIADKEKLTKYLIKVMTRSLDDFGPVDARKINKLYIYFLDYYSLEEIGKIMDQTI